MEILIIKTIGTATYNWHVLYFPDIFGIKSVSNNIEFYTCLTSIFRK